ncbi:MAG: vitamin B12 transporter [Arenicella sp.]
MVAVLFCFSTFSQDTIPEKSKALKVVPIFHGIDWSNHISDLKSSSPRYYISEDKMNDLGVTDVGGAMNFVPGIQLKDYGGVGGIKTVSYRSLGATHTGVTLNNNVLINNQIGTINLSSLQSFGLRNLVFSTGQPEGNFAPASAYLPASTINVYSKVGMSDTATSFQIYQKMTSINDFENGALAHFRIKKRAFVALQGFSNYGSGAYNYVYKLAGTSEKLKRQNAELFNYKLNLGFGIRIKKHAVLYGTVDYFNNQQNLPGAVILFNPNSDQKLANRDWRANLHFVRSTNEWTLHLHSFAAQNETVYDDPTFLNLAGFLHSEYKMNTAGGGFMLSKAFKFYSNKIFIGSDGISSNLLSSEFANSPSRLNLNSVAGFSFWIKKFKLEGNLSHQLIHDQARSGDSITNQLFSRLAPYLSVSVLPFEKEKIRIRAFYKNAFRMPTFNDLYYNYIGNTNLKPENAHLTNFGISYATSSFTRTLTSVNKREFEINIDGFYNYVFNKIVAIPTKDLFNWSMQNIGETQIYGVDASATWMFTQKKWSGAITSSHTLNRSIDKTNSSLPSYGDQIPYTPIYSSSLTAMVGFKGYKINANFFYNGSRYSLNENIPSNYLEGFVDINLGLQKKFSFKNNLALNVNAKAMNILNMNYEVIRSFPMPGRYYQMTLNFSYK